MVNVDLDILFTYGASIQKVKKGEYIFQEGGNAHYYFQLVKGSIKMVSLNKQGRKIILGIFNGGDSFGEPPLFIDKTYPSSAVALEDSSVLKISKEKLNVLLVDYPDIAISLIQNLSNRIYQKSMSIQILGENNPEEKIIGLLDKIKEDEGAHKPIKIPYTRQQIANSTGLCVETVIRTLIKLKEEQVVDIKNHKVYY